MAAIAEKPGEINADVAVVGGGIAGGALAAILAGAGLNVVAIDRESLESRLAPAFDGRTTAISFGSRRVLEAAGAWDDLVPHANPIRQIRIADGTSPAFLHFDTEAVEGRPFGWIIDNSLIRRALAKRAESLPNLTTLAPATVARFEPGPARARIGLADGRVVRAPLMVGADGKGSTMREIAGIKIRSADYHQTALVFIVRHDLPHHDVALEHFHAAGPFAVLPMVDDASGSHRSSVVWTVRTDEAEDLLKLDEAAFDAVLQPLFGDYYGAVVVDGRRFSYRLGLQEARRYVAPRLALAADAAHSIHPIAGQGLNLGLRDVALLAELVIDAARLGLDIGNMILLQNLPAPAPRRRDETDRRDRRPQPPILDRNFARTVDAWHRSKPGRKNAGPEEILHADGDGPCRNAAAIGARRGALGVNLDAGAKRDFTFQRYNGNNLPGARRFAFSNDRDLCHLHSNRSLKQGRKIFPDVNNGSSACNAYLYCRDWDDGFPIYGQRIRSCDGRLCFWLHPSLLPTRNRRLF